MGPQIGNHEMGPQIGNYEMGPQTWNCWEQLMGSKTNTAQWKADLYHLNRKGLLNIKATRWDTK